MDAARREIDAAATVLAGRALLRRAGEALRPHGIVPVVLKGALLSALSEGWGEPPRPMLDVDVLVERERRRAAEAALAAIGLEVVARTRAATTLRDRSLGLDLDLHSALVEPGLFAIDEREVLARAAPDTALFGFEVRIPDRRDLHAHLVAHFARNRSNARDARRLHDFAIVARALPVPPDELASHLVALGLGRAARYVLGIAAARGDSFAGAVVAELPRDPVGDVIARGAAAWLDRFAGTSLLAIPALHALNRSLPAGARSLGIHAAEGLRSRARRVLERPAEGR